MRVGLFAEDQMQLLRHLAVSAFRCWIPEGNDRQGTYQTAKEAAVTSGSRHETTGQKGECMPVIKIEAFIEVPEGTSLRSVENEVSVWIEQCCDMQKDWLSRIVRFSKGGGLNNAE
jgi:hypothetical protein